MLDKLLALQRRRGATIERGETCERLAALQPESVRKDLLVEAAPRRVGVSVTSMIGQRWPLHASATGKLILAELDPVVVRAPTSQATTSMALDGRSLEGAVWPCRA